jgi:hypothetical protein
MPDNRRIYPNVYPTTPFVLAFVSSVELYAFSHRRPRVPPIRDMSISNSPNQSLVLSLFDTALEQFERQTGTSLAQHPLAKTLETCDSIESITDALTEQARDFRRFRGDGGKAMRCLEGVVHVLHSLSTDGVLGNGIGLVRPIRR